MALIEPSLFYFIPHENMRIMLHDVMDAITVSRSWEWLRNYPQHIGFMFVEHKRLRIIKNNLLYRNHNNVSFGIIMGHMEYIAKHGWEAYVRRFKV